MRFWSRSGCQSKRHRVEKCRQLVSRVKDDWQAPVIQIRSLERTGMNLVEEELDKYYRHSTLKRRFRLNRIKQSEYWFEQSLGELLFDKLGEKDWNQKKANFLEKVQTMCSPLLKQANNLWHIF